MLKTNSKKARENIQLYIMENCSPEDYNGTPEPVDFKGYAKFIIDVFNDEYWKHENLKRYYRYNESAAFDSWTRGLPSALDTCYWYNRSAVEDLGNILEETEEEKNKYDEEKAGSLLTYLIFRELKKAVEK